MEKFSLYDLLGLLLPGVLFIYFLRIINQLFSIIQEVFPETSFELGEYICFSLIVGAFLYSLNFCLVQKESFYKSILYIPTGILYERMHSLHRLMNDKLNEVAVKWYDKRLFYTPEERSLLTIDEQNIIRRYQEEFYDRMYYTLELTRNNEHPKSFQSFYFFFRQIVLGCMLSLLLSLALFGLSFWDIVPITNPDSASFIGLLILITAVLILSVFLARWYRKRMVLKMYWAFFISLNQPLNNSCNG